MASGLYPAFVRVFYTVDGLVHVMTRQLHSYTVPDEGHPYGQITRWDTVTQDADEIVEALLEAWADLFTTDMSFNSMFFYTLSTPTAEPLLRAAKNVSIAGDIAIVAGDEYHAVQVTFNFLSTSGSKLRIQLMEASSRNAYAKITDLSDLEAAETVLVGTILDASGFLAARDESQGYIFRSRTCTLNAKMRKERRYT